MDSAEMIQTQECSPVIQLIVSYILSSAGEAPDVEPHRLEQAVKHAAGCQQCLESLDLFAALMGENTIVCWSR